MEPETDPLEMADLLTEIVRALVDHPEDAAVSEQGTETKTSFLLIRTAPDDFGKVVGKQGRTIKSIRELFSRIAAVDGRRVVIEVVDPRVQQGQSRR